MNCPKIDFHIHTVISDGTDTLPVLLDKVREAGIEIFSVTDHDAVKAASALPQLRQQGDLVEGIGIKVCRKPQQSLPGLR